MATIPNSSPTKQQEEQVFLQQSLQHARSALHGRVTAPLSSIAPHLWEQLVSQPPPPCPPPHPDEYTNTDKMMHLLLT